MAEVCQATGLAPSEAKAMTWTEWDAWIEVARRLRRLT